MSKAKRDYLVATPITMSVHKRGEDPHGPDSIHISVTENGEGNAEITLDIHGGEPSFSLEELSAIRQAAAVLVAHFNDNGEVRKC